MTLTEIYNRIVWNIYGDSTPPASVVTYMQGVNGVIANIHKRLQREWNYSWMEKDDFLEVTEGVFRVGLPTDFKEEIVVKYYDQRAELYTNDPSSGTSISLTVADTSGFSTGDTVYVCSEAGEEEAVITGIVTNTSITVDELLMDHTAGMVGVSGYWYILDKYARGDLDRVSRTVDDLSTALSYQVWADYIGLRPVPDKDTVIKLKYYGYMTAPTAGTWATFEDNLTIFGAEAMISLCTSELALTLDYAQKVESYRQKYYDELKQLRIHDSKTRNACLDTMPYIDL